MNSLNGPTAAKLAVNTGLGAPSWGRRLSVALVELMITFGACYQLGDYLDSFAFEVRLSVLTPILRVLTIASTGRRFRPRFLTYLGITSAACILGVLAAYAIVQRDLGVELLSFERLPFLAALTFVWSLAVTTLAYFMARAWRRTYLRG
jgi:hypothetical protein